MKNFKTDCCINYFNLSFKRICKSKIYSLCKIVEEKIWRKRKTFFRSSECIVSFQRRRRRYIDDVHSHVYMDTYMIILNDIYSLYFLVDVFI